MRAGLSVGVALVVFLSSQLLLTRFIQGEQQRDADLERYLALQTLSTYRARLEGYLNANLISIRTLRAEIALTPALDAERFERLVSELLTADVHVRHIAVAPDLVIEHVYPVEGNEGALGFDYRDSPGQLASIRSAIEAGDIVVNGPVDLVQGGRALIGRVPVYTREDGRFWGVISVVIDHEDLFRDAGLTRDDHWRLSLRGVDGRGIDGEVIFGPPGVWERRPVTVPVDLPVGQWVLAAVPASGGWQRPLASYHWRWLVGSVMNLALALLILGLLLSRRRLQGALSTISHQARFDTLTELPNREYFMHRLDKVIQRSRREQRRFALLFIDLDHFKEVNDSLGHEAGDQLLQAVGDRIGSVLRGIDLVGRFGGDEFIVLLRDLADPVDAELVATKILHILHPPLFIKNQEVTIDGSIGIAVYPDDGHSPGDLLQHADLAMYAAKSAGRGTTYFFNDSLRRRAERHLKVYNEIKHGLAREQFVVHYQPVVEAAGHRLVGVEALVRWQHPQRGVVGPDEFIAVAEQTGVIRELGNFVLRRACEDLGRFRRAGMDLRMAVNRSSREFNDRRTVMHWLEVIDACEVPRERLTFEITESVLMPDRSRQHQLLRRLNAEGIGLAIDDFGKGYSSLTYLRKFPVSQIKIDRVFVRDMDNSAEQLALVEALVKMAHALHLEIVAEGVETAGQAAQLAALGCDLFQGFHFGRPMPADELVARFAAGSAAGD